MFNNASIDYAAVRNQTANFKTQLSSEISVLEQAYSSAKTKLETQDGATKTSLQSANENNISKANVTAGILTKLLEFIEKAIQDFEVCDKLESTYFSDNTGLTQPTEVNTNAGRI